MGSECLRFCSLPWRTLSHVVYASLKHSGFAHVKRACSIPSVF